MGHSRQGAVCAKRPRDINLRCCQGTSGVHTGVPGLELGTMHKAVELSMGHRPGLWSGKGAER